MGPITQVLMNSPTWLSPILVLLILGGVLGMFAMMKTTTSRIKNIEETCKQRIERCGHLFELVGEAKIRHEAINGRLGSIEKKLDTIIMQNGWS